MPTPPAEATQLSRKRLATKPTTTSRRIVEGTTPPSCRSSDGTTPSLVPATGGSGYEIKGSIVRAYTMHIEQMGILPEVLSRVTPETRKLMTTEMPLSNVWVDAGVIEDMIGKVEALKGLDGVRTITRAGIYTGALPVLKPVVVPMLRLFGMSPHTLLQRFGQFTKNNLRGMELLWTPKATAPATCASRSRAARRAAPTSASRAACGSSASSARSRAKSPTPRSAPTVRSASFA